MKIYLIRHGETTGDIERRFGGDYDDHLTDKGKQQAEKLAETLRDRKIDVILHSPRVRAVETANIVAKAIGVPVEVMQNLRERNNYGVLTGLTKDEGNEKFPEEVTKLKRDKTYHDVKDSESYESMKERTEKLYAEIGERKESVLAVVTHGGVISTIMREKFGHQKIKIGDCGIVEIEHHKGDKGVEDKVVGLDNASISDNF